MEFESLDAGLILNKMEDADNDFNIVILDACRNNPFARSFRSSIKGLARMDAPKGSIIAYATSPGELAADGEDKNGIYTKHLIRNIQIPELTIEQVFKNVRISVVAETSNKQVPWESSSLMGTFYFVPQEIRKNNVPQASTDNEITDRSTELLFWESIKNSKNPKMFEAYLKQFPKGAFTQLAILNIVQNKTTEQAAKSLKPNSQRPVAHADTGKKETVKSLENKSVMPASTETTKTASNPGILKINCNVKGANVFIDKEKRRFLGISYMDWIKRGQTPFIETQLEPGKHDVKVSLSGYEKYAQAVNLISGKTTILDVVLEKKALNRGGGGGGGSGGSGGGGGGSGGGGGGSGGGL